MPSSLFSIDSKKRKITFLKHSRTNSFIPHPHYTVKRQSLKDKSPLETELSPDFLPIAIYKTNQIRLTLLPSLLLCQSLYEYNPERFHSAGYFVQKYYDFPERL